MPDRLGHRPGVPQGEFGVAADRGDRVAQFVAGVGGESAQPFLDVLTAGQRVPDVAEHPVQRGADPADLGARVVVRDALAEVDRAAGQGQRGDSFGGGHHPFQRAQREAGAERADDRGEGQRDGEHDEFDQQQALHGLVDGVQREAGDQHVPVVAGEGGGPVVAEHGQREVARPAVRRQGAQGADVRPVERDGGVAVGPLRDRDGVVVAGRDAADDGGVRDGAAHQPGAEGAGRLGAGVVAVLVGVFEAGRVPAAGRGQLLVEPVDQEVPQRLAGGDADAHADQGDQHQHARHQPGPQGARAQRGAARPRRGGHPVGALRT